MEKRKSTSNPLRVYAAPFGVLGMMLLGLAMGMSSNEGPLVGAGGVPETPPPSRLSNLNLVQNGGFENDLDGWEKHFNPATAEQQIQISSALVHAGAKALEVLGDASPPVPGFGFFAFVGQSVYVPFDSTEISFWVYPASAKYKGRVVLGGTSFDFQDDGSVFFEVTRIFEDGTVERVNDTVANVIVSSSWNKVVIQVDGANRTQHLFINDNLVSSLTAPFSFPPATAIGLGDMHSSNYYGTMYFDDISITGTPLNSPSPPWARPDEVVYNTSSGEEEVASELPGKLINILANDSDPNQDSIWVKSITQPKDGIAAFDTTFRGLSITPKRLYYRLTNTLNHAPTDKLEYTITDGTLDSTTTVTILFDEGCPLVPSVAALKYAGSPEAIDLALIRRFRDEVMKMTVDGARIVDYYYNTTPEILRILLLERRDLAQRAVEMVEMLQPSIRDVLEDDGSLPITQAQMDSVAAFFTDLSAAASDSLQQLITDEMDRLGALDDYVGLPVGDVLQTVLGAPVNIAIEDQAHPTPSEFVLEQNFPNPFEAETEIRYALSRPTAVTLTVYDIQGRKVRMLIEGQQEPGVHSVTWDGLDAGGMRVPSGVYFVRLTTPTFEQAKKMILRK